MTHFVEDIESHMHSGPVDVRIVGGPEETKASAPEFSAWKTLQLTGQEGTQPLIPYNDKREHCNIVVIPGLAGNVNGSVFIGTQNQVDNGQGAVLKNGSSFTVKGRSQLFIKGDGVNSLWVTVVDERFA